MFDLSNISILVCSEVFNKCYVFFDLTHPGLKALSPSWSFVDSVCKMNKWTMVSLHNKLENDFVSRYVQNRFNVTEIPYLYIGKYTDEKLKKTNPAFAFAEKCQQAID